MLQPAARCRAALRLAASDPIQASEAKAPLAESLGVCAALTRIGFDVSEAVSQPCAVPLTAPSVPAAPGSEDSVDVRVASFGSEQSRPTSALGLGLGLGLRVGQRTRAQHGPTALRWLPRGGRASTSVEAEPCLLLRRAAGAARPTGAARGRFAEGPGRTATRGAFPAGYGVRQAARRARKTAERRAASWGRRLLGGSIGSGRLVSRRDCSEYRLGSLPTKREWS